METNKKKNMLLIAGAIGMVIVLLMMIKSAAILVSLHNSPVNDRSIKNLVIDTSAVNTQRTSDALVSRQLHLPGIPDGSLASDAPLLLSNPAANEDIFLQYTIINDATGETVFESDLIESAKAVEWIPGQTLAPGDYSFTLIEQPYYKAEGADGWFPLTTGNNHVNITIME